MSKINVTTFDMWQNVCNSERYMDKFLHLKIKISKHNEDTNNMFILDILLHIHNTQSRKINYLSLPMFRRFSEQM